MLVIYIYWLHKKYLNFRIISLYSKLKFRIKLYYNFIAILCIIQNINFINYLLDFFLLNFLFFFLEVLDFFLLDLVDLEVFFTFLRVLLDFSLDDFELLLDSVVVVVLEANFQLIPFRSPEHLDLQSATLFKYLLPTWWSQHILQKFSFISHLSPF